MSESLETIGLAAVDRFIETWNSRDPEAWAGSLNFPHARPGPFGPLLLAKNAEEYISRVDFNRVIETGWDRSEWDYKHVVQLSPNKIHVVGQWHRENKAGETILTNPVTYIVTLVDGNWGVQSRFSADYAGEEDTSSMEKRGFNLVESFFKQFNAGSAAACAEMLNYPHFSVGVGSIGLSETAADYRLPEASLTIESMMALQTGKRSINIGMDFVLSEAGRSRAMQAVLNITERDDHLGIQAWSLLNPNPVEDQS